MRRELCQWLIDKKLGWPDEEANTVSLAPPEMDHHERALAWCFRYSAEVSSLDELGVGYHADPIGLLS